MHAKILQVWRLEGQAAGLPANLLQSYSKLVCVGNLARISLKFLLQSVPDTQICVGWEMGFLLHGCKNSCNSEEIDTFFSKSD